MPTPIAPLPAGLNTSGSTGTTDTTLSNIPTGSTSTNPLTVFNPQPAASTDQTQVAPAVVTPDAALKDLNHMQTVATNATTDMQNQSAKKVAATGDGTTGTGGLGIVDTIKGLISPITDQLAKNSKTNAQANADITAMNNNVHNPAPTGTTSSTTSTTPAPNPYLDKLQANQDEADKAYQDFKTQISQLQNGTFPLTPSQQAQIDGLQARFDQLKAAQQLANKNYEAGTTQVGIRTGQERYAPKIAQDNIKKAVDQGLQKIADIESQAADAVAKMTDGFQTQDFNLISKSYEAYNSYMKDKNDTLKTMMNEVDTQAKDLRDYNLNVQQFQQKQAEDNFSNAMANKTFDFNQKKQAFDEYIAKADLTEKQKTDAVDQWYKQQDIAIKQSNLALDRQKENFREPWGVIL